MPKQSAGVPSQVKPIFDEIVQLIDSACRQCLDEECAGAAALLVAALARKRPSPLLKGKRNVWAAGVIFTIARVNFLFDPSVQPSCRPADLAAACGVSQSSASAKARDIERLFGIGPFDRKWTLASKLDDNTMAWLIMIDGLIVDVRTEPRDIQEEAFRLGLIPYLP